jgi:uncharacterized cupin superfamily protein
MSTIRIEHHPDAERLKTLDVDHWPIWTKEVSEFPWEYDAEETCYVLEGQVTVTPEDGKPVEIGPGDLVTFPRGMRCTWRVEAPIRKHYILA